MLETTRRREQLQLGGAGGGDLFGTGDDPGLVTLVSGCYSQQLPVANMSVKEVRRRFGDRMDVDNNSLAIVDGHQVTSEDQVLKSGEVLMFTKRSGEKGTLHGELEKTFDLEPWRARFHPRRTACKPSLHLCKDLGASRWIV